MEKRRLQIHYCFVQGIYWVLAAIMAGFLTPILQDKGFTSIEIGSLLAVKHVSSIFVQLLVSDFADRHADKILLKHIIALCLIIGIIATAVFYSLPTNFMVAVGIFLIFGATLNIIVSFVDAMAIQYANVGKNISYTLARGCGSFTWAVASILIGMFADVYGAVQLLVVQMMVAGSMLVAIWTIEPVSDTPGKKKEPTKNVHGISYLLKNYPGFTLFLIATFFSTASYNTGSCFMIDIVRGAGGGQTEYGIVSFILAIVEIPTAIFFTRLRKMVGLHRLLEIFAISNTLKAVGLFFAQEVYQLYMIQILEMFGFGLFYAGSVYFVMESLPVQDVVKGTALITVAVNGIGTGVASVYSGWILSAFGLKVLLASGIGLGILGVMMMYLAMRKHESGNSFLCKDADC